MNKLLNRAMSLLARRDHSEQELRRKLAAQISFSALRNSKNKRFQQESPETLTKDELAEQIEAVIQYCYEYHWLDDKKFTYGFIRGRSAKGYGPQRIKSELLHKGVDKHTINIAFDECDIDWVELARKLIEKRFDEQIISDWKGQGKVYNYLANKGFCQDEIREALKSLTF